MTKKKSSRSQRTANLRKFLLSQGSKTCYLTGRPLTKENMSFDHVIPRSKGGTLSRKNTKLCDKQANNAKGGMSVEEFLQLCKEVLIHWGYV